MQAMIPERFLFFFFFFSTFFSMTLCSMSSATATEIENMKNALGRNPTDTENHLQ